MVYHSVYGGGWGSFGKGFSESFAAMLKLIEDKRHNEALEAHWARMDANNPYAAANAAGAAGRAGFKEGDTGTYGGDGGGAASGNLSANQTTAYNAARAEGLSDSSARAFVANVSGESLTNPADKHLDPNGKQNAFGMVQWDDARAAAIQKQFGKMPNEMSIAEQTHAAIWEMKNDPTYANSWIALNSEGSVQDKIRTLVTNYERPKDPDTSIQQRIAFAGRLPTTFAGESGTGTQTASSGVKATTTAGAGQTPIPAPLDTPELRNLKPQAAAAVNKALDSAKGMLGKNEVPDHDEVMAYLHGGGQDLDPHKSAWCAAFVSASLKKAGLPVPTVVRPGTETGPGNVAGDYKTWGTGVDAKSVQAGDVLVANDGSHVGFAEGAPRMGKNGPEVKMIAGNEPDTSGRYHPGSYTMQTGRVINRAQVGQVGERWVPLSQYTARRAEPGTTSDGRTAAVDPSAPASEKVAAAKAADGSYQVAGLNDIALTPEQAAKSRRDLEAHRANQIPPTPVTFDQNKPQQIDQGPPPPRPGDRINAIPPGPSVPAQDTAFKPPFEANYPPSAQTLPVEPPMTTQQGPESPYAPPDARGATLQPSDQPSSGVATSVLNTQQGPPQRTGAPPTVGPTPSSAPPPVMGPPQRTGAPPNVGITPSSAQGPPETRNMPVPPVGAGGEYRNMPFVGETASGNQRDPKGVYGPKPDKVASADKTADTPSKDAQPTAATKPAITPTPRVNQPEGLPAGVIRYEVPNSSASRAPIYTAANFSSLWGPNPPVAQRGQAAASPPVAAAPSRQQDDYSDVASMPSQGDYNLGNQIMGSRKGGPIQRFANGGIPMRPTMKFQGGGNPGGGWSAQSQSAPPTQYTGAVPYATWNSPTSTTYVPSASQPSMGVYAKSLAVPSPNPAYSGYQPWGGVLGGSGAMAKSNYASMTPDQQAWFNQQMANSQATGNQWYYNPASYPTTPAPAAPAAATPTPTPAPVVQPTTGATVAPIVDTTIIDPTTTAGAGAPGLPKNITAKSYDPNVDAKTGAGFANTNNAGGTNYTVDPKDTLKTNDAGDTISGFRQGGGIPSRPTMKYADAGTVSFSAPGYQGSRTQGEQYFFSPDYNGPTYGGGWQGTPYAQLAPNQQAWADTMRPLANYTPANFVQNASQFTVMPTAVWPTAAAPAAAPAGPAVAPTTTATTQSVAAADPNNQAGAGAPGLPNSLAPTPTPVVDPTTNTVTNTPDNPVPKQAKTYDPTQDTAGKYAKRPQDVGGSNYERSIDPTSASDFGANNYGQIQGFDDGGGVNPSALGMPPGLSGGGQQPPPPIYYNGATYAPAGAPVGKGVTQSSVPTYIAGAIPSLPMVQGGMVRYAEGGSVDEYSGVDTSDRADDDVAQGGRSEQQGWSGQDTGGAAAPAQDAYATASSPQDVHPDLPAWTPQVNDGQGNPSRGLIGAISGGLHYIASQLGLSGDGQPQAIAGDPNIQANRRSFVQGGGLPGAPVPTHEEVAQLHQAIGTSDGLHEGLANLAGMEATRNFWLVHGDPQKADMMAASMLQYSVGLSRDYGDQAVQRYYRNDLNGAVHALNKAKEAIADGTMMNATVNDDGTVNVEGRNLSGQQLWAQTVGPEAILGAALHARDGSLAWHLYELQAAKYDPATANIIKMRQERSQQAAVDEQIGKLGPVSTPYTGGAPDSQAPQITPVNVPPAPQAPTMSAQGPLAPGQPAIPGPPQVAALTPPVTAGGLGIDASRGQISPEQQAILDANRGRSADTTTAQTAAPPRTADNNQVAAGDLPAPPAPAGTEQDQQQQVAPAIPANAAAARAAIGPQPTPTPGVGPTREVAANLPAPDAQEVAELSPVAEQARYRQIEQTVRAKYTDPQTHGIVLDGQLYQIPQVPDQATYSKMAPQLQNYWKDRMATYRWAASEADKRAAQEIDAERRDYGVSLASQRADATMRRQQGFLDQREQASRDAATLAEQRKQTDALQLEKYKAALNEHNTTFSANSAGVAPRGDTEMESMVGEGKAYDPYVEMAKAFFPDMGAKADRPTAINYMTQHGVDLNTQRTLVNAWTGGVRHSRDTSPDEVASALQSFVTGGQFVAKAESTDARGNPLPQHGTVRYDVSIEDNTGNMIGLKIPAGDLANLRNLRLQSTRAMQEKLGKQVSAYGVLGLPPGAQRPGMPAQPALGVDQPGGAPAPIDWGARSPAETTQQPPF